MCRECVEPASYPNPVIFTHCEYCEQLSDHIEQNQNIGTVLTCVNCDHVIPVEHTQNIIAKTRNNWEKIGLTYSK